MSILLIFLFGVLVFFLISQFGGKLTARNSLVWWCIFGFLGWCVIGPATLQPVAHLLGIQLVSNFVLATMILFLAFQAIQESAFSTKQFRKLRDLVSSLAAETYFVKYQGRNEEIITGKIKVLIGMPCYNEALHLPTLAGEIETFLVSQKNSEFDFLCCIVNDGSSDSSRRILDKELSKHCTHHASNVGVAGVLLTAFKAASLVGADYVVQCDSDGQHPLNFIPELVREAIKTQSDLIIGSRYAQIEKDESSTQMRRFGSRIIVSTIRLFFGKNEISDPTSGFRVYSRKAQDYLLSTMPDEYPEPETIALLLTKELKMGEIPVKMSARQAGVSSLNGFAGARFMIKVLSALLGLRIRTFL